MTSKDIIFIFKAYVGFRFDLSTPVPGVATGNWGCGAYHGDKHLKTLIQLMACCVNKRPIVYYTFGDMKLRDDMFIIYDYLVKNKVRIAELWSYLQRYSKECNKDLFKFVITCHQSK